MSLSSNAAGLSPRQAAVLIFSKQDHIFFGYFDPENNFKIMNVIFGVT